MSGSREQLRAVFLAFVMVTSIMAAGVAFSGSAAAQSGSTIQVSDLNDGADAAQNFGLTATATQPTGGPTVNAQGLDSTATTSAPTGLTTTPTTASTPADSSGNDGTFDNGETASFTIDVNGDGTSDETVYVSMETADQAIISLDNDFTGSNLGDNQVSIDGTNDEEITGIDGSTANKDITLGTHTFNVQIIDDTSATTDEVQYTSTTYYTGSFQVDAGGDQQVDDTVNFALADADSDGLYEDIELSLSDTDYGEGGLSDNSLADGNDEQITGQSGNGAVGASQEVVLGNSEFNIRYDDGTEESDTGSDAVGDASVDVTATAQAYEATGQTAGDSNLDIASFDTDSDGVYDQVAISASGENYDAGSTSDGTVDLTGNSNSEIFSPSSNNVLTFVGASDSTKFNVRSSETFQDPVNNNIELELGFEFNNAGTAIGTYVDTNNNIRIDTDQDQDFDESSESSTYTEGDYLTDDKTLAGSPIGSFGADYVVEEISASTATIEPVPKAGFGYDFRIYDSDDANTDVYVDDLGVEAISPDDGDWVSPISVTLDGSGYATISGLNFQYSTNAGDDTANSIDVNGVQTIGVAQGTGNDANTVADVEVQSSDYGTVSISSNVDSLTYNTAQDVTVTVTDDGSSLQGASVKLIQDADPDEAAGTSTLATGFTDSNGEVTFTGVKPSAAGEFDLQVTADRGGDTATTTAADGITDLQTSTTNSINAKQLQTSTSANFLQDFSTNPEFTVKYSNGTTFDKAGSASGADAAGDGAEIFLSGSVLDTAETNLNGDNWKEDSFVAYVVDQADGTYIDQVDAGDEIGVARPTTTFTPDSTGTLEVRAEYQTSDDADTPAEYNGTSSFDVTQAGNLNINTNEVDALDADGSQDNLRVTVQGSDAAGPDGSTGNNLDTASVQLSGPGVSADTGGQVDFTTGAPYNDATSNDAQSIDFDSINPNNNGTVTVTVNAVADDGDEFTKTTNVSVAGNKIQGLSPTGTITSGQGAQISLNVTNGDGTALNNQQVVISEDGLGSSSAALFKADITGDSSEETINKILIDGAQGTIAYDTNDDATNNPGDLDTTAGQWETTKTITVNNGLYQTPQLTANTAGDKVDVDVYDTSNNIQAFNTDFLTTQGNQTYNVNSDVNTFVAGYEEQVNITVTNTTSGQQVNGSTLQRLADTDSDTTTDNFLVEQQGTSVISGVSTVDTNSDNTVDTIRGVVDADEDGSAAVNITTRTNNLQDFGTASVAVQAPQVQTNVTNAQLTENIQQNVNIEVVDPRDTSKTLASDNNGDNPALRLTAFNTSLEVQDLDAGNDFDVDGTSSGASVEPAIFDASNTNNGQANATVMAYPDGDSGPQRLNFEVSFDGETDYFGSDNVTVGAQQVTATPSSISLGSQTTLEVSAVDANGQAIPQQGVSLSGAASTSGSTDDSGFIAFTVNPSATGKINVNVDSDGLDVAGGVSPSTSTTEDTVNVTTQQSEFSVSVSPQNVTANQSSSVTVTATNNGTGNAVESASVSLSGAGVSTSAQTGANGEATLNVNASQTGTIDVTVNKAGYNPSTATITVDAEPEPTQPTGTNFTVSNLNPQNVTVTNGTAINVSATITNDGNASGSQTVEFRVDGTALASQTPTIDAGNSTTVNFTNIDTGALGAGTYTHGVFTNDDSQTATLTVEEDAPAYYTLSLSHSTADRAIQTTIISTFSTYRQSGSTALLPRSVYRYTRTHTGGQR